MIAEYKINRGKLVEKVDGDYKRYKLSSDGISERLIPGQKGVYYQANSYEHVEDGHTTEDAKIRIEQARKRSAKWDTYLKDHYRGPQVIGDIAQADVCFVSWGSNKGIIVEAMKLLSDSGKKSALIHFTHIYPMNEQSVRAVIPENKRCILIETNSHAQFGKLLRMETGINIAEKLLKYDGRPFLPEEIVNYVNKSNV